ncbi:right-handed parallel beta-helix repeat-containing protein [Flavivirga spongiicola]|uniref:Right-handed parallel beta-helix repeat-containing protein n=1 Tax=Flavivirga spongiicola TaxID=421621 RepID=A0ABU7XP73_9FLAO|nr:right-handed parallel beta-helix repeat-containing protein [Flavivirga sp. MEBiC05379]MDO5981887.1 right-handed parallel beta-helix repeat-containing protein [Flavivirga sp. MEBiC05379]
MKNLLYYLLMFMSCIAISCSKEKIDDSPEDIEKDMPPNTITTPCGFDLYNVTANSTIIIDCVLDLKEETITLPTNVIVEFGGGDIINGKLNFSSGGKIDGRLLSSKLKLEGDVTLIDPTFKFYALRWDLFEGKTNSEVALKNNNILESVMFFTKELGATTFNIDKLDAYFEITKVTSTTTNVNWYPSQEAVNIPSDFNLVMTDNTHLRVFPAQLGISREGATLLAVRHESNVTITGGILHGDREQRQYSEDDGQEGSHLFHIHSGKNVTLDGIKFIEGSVGSITIYSTGFSFNPNYDPTTGVIIKNCEFLRSRRMAIALTDGRDVLIENNTFIDTGLPSPNSKGGEVGYAINIEPDRYRDENGVLKERQRVFNVLIKGNTETGSRGGFVTLTIGQDLTVEDNDIGTRVVYSFVSRSKVINNRFKATGTATESWAIFAAGTGVTVFDNEIAGNTIEGYSLGIVTGSNEAYVHENVIKDCGAGIQLSKAFKARIHNNAINVSGNGIQATNTHSDDVEIKGNEITSGGFHAYLTNLNNKEEYKDYKIVLDGNKFLNTNNVTISNAQGITFKNNEVNGGLGVGNVSHVEVSSNNIKPNESDGIRTFGTNASFSILNNIITEPTGADRYECINNGADNPDATIMTGNACN